MKQPMCLAAIVLWVLTLLGGSWLFVMGWTKPGSDGRIEILLAPSDRNQILAE